MKWLLAILAASLAVGFFILQRNAVKTSYVNGLPPYTNLPGRDFIVERDCYIFKFKSRDSDWPYLASHATVGALPAEVTEASVGRDFPDVRVLGVVKVGDHFRIASVRRDEGRGGTRITFEVALSNESTRPYPRLDAYWIMDHSPERDGKAPWIMTDYAVAVGKE
jgi:hypothetical protein